MTDKNGAEPEKPEAGEEATESLRGFVVIQTGENNLQVQPLNQNDPVTVDDIYSMCGLVRKNIEIQQTAQAIHAAMSAVAQQVSGQTKEGIVIPKGTVKNG